VQKTLLYEKTQVISFCASSATYHSFFELFGADGAEPLMHIDESLRE